ncbi:hypothetical protein B0O80DRAFT_500163 [Mortierella sp. GBAus27b]|nr:hypothetical protein BGX31_001231 [Mortierella sp. GBA43]KAI8351296.1 hypothetical protein B0O80DRAFT_500163 [Mortierella sp. GBAus27b]
MTIEDNEMQRLWKLTNDLTAQLVFNRSATLELKQQLATLQSAATGHAPIYAISGNRDPGDYQLRLENERLREENLQLQEQLREYERWMEFIMGKFRLQNLAMAQCRKESMEEAYKVAEQGGEAAMRLQEENALLQSRLADLSAVARKAINEEYYTTETVIESLETENRCLREMLGLAEGGNGAFMGRFSFHVDEDDDEDALRRHRNAYAAAIPTTAAAIVRTISLAVQPTLSFCIGDPSAVIRTNRVTVAYFNDLYLTTISVLDVTEYIDPVAFLVTVDKHI